MMRRPSASLAALLALAWLPPLAAEPGPPASLAALSEPILVQRDPSAASAFLSRADLQALRPGDPDLFDRTFRAASEESDLALVLKTHTDPAQLREALGAREDFELVAAPGALAAWARRRLPDVDQDFVRAGVYEWGSLTVAMRAELKRGGSRPEGWARASFAERRAAVTKVAQKALEAVKKTVPRSQAELDALQKRADALDEYLTHDEQAESAQALDDAKAVVKGLADAERRVKASGDPRLQAALAQVRSAPDSAEALSRLSHVFDGLGVRSAAVTDAGPGRADQRFTDKQRGQLADMLKTGVLREMRGTVVGDEVGAFLDKRDRDGSGFDLRVAPLDPGTMGLFDPKTKVITISQQEVEHWLRKENRSVESLLQGGEPFQSLLYGVLSTTVHEAIHLQQDSWQHENRLPDWGALNQENEAKAREAAFYLEKAARDPAYRRFMRDSQKRFSFVRTVVSQGATLARDPAAFRAENMTDYYPGRGTNETDAAGAAASDEAADRADAPRVYSAYRARDERVWSQVTQVLAWVRAHPNGEPAPSRVPPPAVHGGPR